MENNATPHIELEVSALAERKKPSLWKVLFGTVKADDYCVVLRPSVSDAVPKTLPVIIGKQEAMAMAITLEQMASKLPLTMDLFKNATEAFGYKLDTVVIDKLDEEGTFHSTMSYSNNDKKVELHARLSDAVTMALKCNVPIYMVREIFDRTAIAVPETT